MLKGHSQKDRKLVLKTNHRLMQVISFAERFLGQYVRPLLRYQLSLRSLFCLFLSGRFTQDDDPDLNLSSVGRLVPNASLCLGPLWLC